MPTIGFVKKMQDGSYKGEFKTLSIQAPLEIRPNPGTGLWKGPDFRVFIQEFEVGEGWTRVSVRTQEKYVALTLAILEFGSRKILANLCHVPGQDDEEMYSVIWIPGDPAAKRLDD